MSAIRAFEAVMNERRRIKGQALIKKILSLNLSKTPNELYFLPTNIMKEIYAYRVLYPKNERFIKVYRLLNEQESRRHAKQSTQLANNFAKLLSPRPPKKPYNGPARIRLKHTSVQYK